MRQNRKAAVLVGLAALALPATAAAGPVHQYTLKHPKREHCRVHYTRRVEKAKHRTVCLYTPPKAAAPSVVQTFTIITKGGTASYPTIQGRVGRVGAPDLIGVPITYTLENVSTRQPLGTFPGVSDPTEPCALRYTIEGTTQTFVGEASFGVPACGLAAVSLPTGQIPAVVASFAGSPGFGPSVSEPAVL